MWTYVVIAVAVVFVILLCVALAIASFSFENYTENLKKLDEFQNSYGISTLEYVENLNKTYFGNNLSIEKCEEFRDHYSSGKIALSENTMQSNSLASLSIVSHELGHARQDFEGESLRKHWKLRRAGKILNFFFMPLMIVGIVFSLLNVFGVLENVAFLAAGLSCAGLALLIFAFSIFLKYKEIKIEKEASAFAIEFLKEILTTEEHKLCRDFLNSARLTYWASLFRQLLSWTFLTKK